MEQWQFYRFLWQILLKGIAMSIVLKTVLPLTVGIVGLVLKSLPSDAQYQIFSNFVNAHGPTGFIVIFFDFALAGWVWQSGEDSYFSPNFFAIMCLITFILSMLLQGFIVMGLTLLFRLSFLRGKAKSLTTP